MFEWSKNKKKKQQYRMKELATNACLIESVTIVSNKPLDESEAKIDCNIWFPITFNGRNSPYSHPTHVYSLSRSLARSLSRSLARSHPVRFMVTYIFSTYVCMYMNSKYYSIKTIVNPSANVCWWKCCSILCLCTVHSSGSMEHYN